MSPAQTLLAAREQLGGWLTLLAELVETNTHADNDDGIARCHALLQPRIEGLGLIVERVSSEGVSPRDPARAITRRHLLAHTPEKAGRPTVLFMGHLDTVFPVDDPFQRLERLGDEWRGPGVSDMKGGIVTALLTLRLLRDAGRLDDVNWRLILASDEEQGSPTALPVLERAARGVDVALCFEAARPCGGIVKARKGYGSARIRVRGKTGHAGIAHDTAVNAFSALAAVVVKVEALEARYPGLSVSPGGAVDVRPAQVTSIPDRADCEVEWRFVKPADGDSVTSDLREIARSVATATRAEVQIDGGVECAPMAPTEASERLVAHYVQAARDLGMDIEGVSTGGVGDINFVAKLGAVCLDGVGPEGGGFHTGKEFVLTDSIARRASMNVSALARCLDELTG